MKNAVGSHNIAVHNYQAMEVVKMSIVCRINIDILCCYMHNMPMFLMKVDVNNGRPCQNPDPL